MYGSGGEVGAIVRLATDVQCGEIAEKCAGQGDVEDLDNAPLADQGEGGIKEGKRTVRWEFEVN